MSMVDKYLVTENEYLSMTVDPADGHLKATRDNGDGVDFGKVSGDVTPEALAAKVAAEAAADRAEAVGDTNDAIMAGVAADSGSAFATQISAKYVDREREPVNAAAFGFSKPSVLAAIDAAQARGVGTTVRFTRGTYDVGAGLDLTGKSIQIQGEGAYQSSGSNWFGTVFEASAQAGPVLDFTGWVPPSGFVGRVTHSGFVVKGSEMADPTKNNVGIRVRRLQGARFADISIINTGGPCLEGIENSGDAQYMSEFERIAMRAPIGVVENDVPYMIFNEANACEFRRLGFYAGGTAANVGASGAMVINSPPTFASSISLYDAIWFENMRVPTGGTIVNVKGRKHVFRDLQFFDCYKVAGATGTSYYRFQDSPGVAQGGNEVRGLIPGRDPDFATSIDYGVDMQQSFNRVAGVKGRSGHNVLLASGVAAHVDLGGSAYSATTVPAVDQTGTASSNTVIIDGGGGLRKQSGWDDIGTNGITHPLSNLVANVTLTTAMHTVVMNGTSLTVTLPDPTTVNRGREWVVKNIHATDVTVVSAGTSKTIDGLASIPITQWQKVRVVSNGTNWVTV